MNLDFVNIITALSVVVAIGFLVLTIYETRKERKRTELLSSKIKEEMNDYAKILQATHGIETAREKNKGIHFENENVYLNRADEIRKTSSLFSWINEC